MRMLFELFARFFVVASVQLGNGVIEVLLRSGEGQFGPLKLARWQVTMYILAKRSLISMGAVGASFSKAASARSNLPCCSNCTAASMTG